MSVSNTYPPDVPDWNTQQDTLEGQMAGLHQGPDGQKPPSITKIFIVCVGIIALFVLGSVAMINKDYISGQISALLSTKSPQASFEVTISNTSFLVPGTYLHRLEYGTGANTTKAHLILPWRKGVPGKDPTYIVSATLMAQGKLTPQALFQRVFLPFLDGPPKAFGLGMKVYTFKPGSPYASEKLYERKTTKGTQLVRCLAVPGTPQNGHCQANILVANGVTLRYRLAHNLLSDWPQIDAGLAEFIKTLMVKTGQKGK